MATAVGQLTIEMAANIVRLQQDMAGARKTVDGAMESITKSVQTAMRTVSGLFAGVSIGAFGGKLISVEREFGKLNASLVTVTGSTLEAEKAFAMLTDFADTTPFSLQEVTAAFIKLKAMGLDPSSAALTSYGNTASAMGKTLNQMIEAVADAATGQFERLLDFGIKSKSEGDKVTFLFRGISTTIGKNADEIVSYLRRIGDEDFAGGMERQSKTLDGAISNLAGAWDKLFATINNEMTGPLLMASVIGAESAIKGLSDVVKNFTQFMEDNKVALLAFAAILAGPAIVAGIGAAVAAFTALKIAVVGLTLAFAANPIALAILAITAAAVPAITGIQKYMNANKALEKEQAGLNQTQAETERLLRQSAPVTSKAAVATNVLTDAQKKAAEEQKKQIANYTKLINDIEGKTGVMLAEQQQTEKLSESQKLALKIMQDIQNGTLKLNDAQKIKLYQSLEEMLNTAALNEEMKKQAESYKKVTKEIGDKTLALAEEQDGTENLTSTQKLALKIMQDIQAGTLTLSDAQKIKITQDLKQLINTERLNAANKDLQNTQKAAIALSDRLNEEQGKQTESIRENVIKLMEQNEELRFGKEAVLARQIAVMRATAADLEFASTMVEGNEHLAEQARLLRQQADLAEENSMLSAAKGANAELEKTTQSINTIESSLTDALMRGFESGKDFGKNLADTLVNMFKTLVLKPIIQPIAQAASSSVLSSMGMSMGANGLMIGGATLAAQGSAFASGFMSSVSGMFSGGAPVTSMGSATSAAFNMGGSAANIAAMAMPYVAAALVALNALGVFRSNRTVGGGITGTLGGDLQEYDLNRRGGTLFDGPDYSIANMRVTETTEGMNAAFTQIRNASVNAAISLGAYNTGLELFTYTLSERLHPDLNEIGLMLDGLTDEQKQEKIRGVLMAAQEAMAGIIIGASGLKLAGETAVQALNRLMVIQSASEMLNEFGGAFTNFATASVTARQGIIELAGGLDALIQKTQGFVANFYSKEEQAGITAKGVVAGLTTAGFTASQIAALETRSDLRTLLESIDVSTTQGQKQFVAILDLQQQFADIQPMLEEQNKNLFSLIEAAPQVEILQRMFETDAAYQERVTQAEDVANALYVQMVEGINAVNISIQHMTTTLANRMGEFTENASVVIDAYASIGRPVEGEFQIDREGFEYWIEKLNAGLIVASRLPAYFKQAAEELVAKDPSADFAQHYLDLVSTRGFASGGYMTGPALVGEHGPELFDPRTSQIYTAPATNDIFGGNEMTAEIRALRDEVSMMRHETRATAVNTSKIARLQDNWDVRGLTVRTDVDQPLDTVTV
jgi:hypothetical protein